MVKTKKMSEALKLHCPICGKEYLSPVKIDEETGFKVVDMFCSDKCEKKFIELIE